MVSLRKAGASAAFVEAGCYIIGFVAIATVLNPGNTEDWSQLQKLEFILARKLTFQMWNIAIYLVFGLALVVLASAIHAHLRTHAPEIMAVATPFGMIWAGLVIASGMVANVGLEMVAATYSDSVSRAAEAWAILGAVQDGLGGGVEIVGGMWVLLLSLGALRSPGAFPASLSFLGLFTGTAGLLTIVPALGALGAVFGLSQIVWFVYVGIVLLQQENVE